MCILECFKWFVGLLILAQGLSASNHTTPSRSCKMYSGLGSTDPDWDGLNPDGRVLENWIRCVVGLIKCDYGQASFGATASNRWADTCLSGSSFVLARFFRQSKFLVRCSVRMPMASQSCSRKLHSLAPGRPSCRNCFGDLTATSSPRETS